MATLPARFPSTPAPITETHVRQAQQVWADAVIALGQAHLDGTSRDQILKLGEDLVDRLYAFDQGPVLFKPTRAAERPFRSTRDDALSYFVGGSVAEDTGFALQPWVHVEFLNHQIAPMSDSTLAMGHYVFTETETLRRVTVEYTLGYRRDAHGEVRIHLHHSSVPFSSAE